MLVAYKMGGNNNLTLKKFHQLLRVVSTISESIKIFKQHPLSFYVVSKIFITQNYLFAFGLLVFIALLLHILKQELFKTNTVSKEYDDVYQCLNTDHVSKRIQYFDDSTLQKILNNWIKSFFKKYSAK